MQRLPIPPLEQTLERFLNGISPILTSDEQKTTEAATDDFKTNGGPVLQQKLLNYANKQADKNISWLTELKLADYLQDTRPHAITNNASLQLDFQTPLKNIARAASFVYRITCLHIDYINDAIEQPVDGRGQPISMYNWRMLTGAIRQPSLNKNDNTVEGDYYYYAPKESANRNISLFWKGHHFVIPVTDAEGKLIPVEQIYLGLLKTLCEDYAQPDINFTELSALGSSKVAHYLNELCQQAHNKQAYDALKDSLFCLSLYHSGADDVTQIQKQTFMPGHAWQLKPNTYQMDLDSDFLAIHFEHSEIDGAAIQHMINYAFGLVDNAPDELKSSALLNRLEAVNNNEASSLDIQCLDWQCNDKALLSDIKQDIESVRQQASQIKVKRCEADYSELQGKVSHDALMQFALVYAQLKVFSQVRNAYEAVDTSHFMAGRTEALRPNSEQAILLAQAMLDDTANFKLLEDALTAHKQRVIACKKGQAFDRHLSGLKLMMTELLSDSEQADADTQSMQQFFNSPGYQTLTGGDFLSTSSMGTQSPVKRILFAPVMEGGFGVNYSLDDTHYEFVFFGDKDSSRHLEQMCQASVEAIDKLVALTKTQ